MNNSIQKVLFIGSKQIGLEVIKTIYNLIPKRFAGVITINDHLDVRTCFNKIFSFTNEKKIPLFIAENRKHFDKLIYEIKPDICFVVGWYWIISEDTLKLVPNGFIGIHNSLLPKYKGSAPLVWSIINGEATVGFSVFSFSKGMDDGPIWMQKKIIVEKDDYISDILKKFEIETIKTLNDLLLDIVEKRVQPISQSHLNESFCAQRLPEDGKINWKDSSIDIYNFIRSQSYPYPGAFTFLDSKKLIIWKVQLFDSIFYGTPGQVAQISSEGVYVICGDNRSIILEEVELDGIKTKAKDLIKSIKTRF